MYRKWHSEALEVPLQEQDQCRWCRFHEQWRMNECGVGNPDWDDRWIQTDCPAYEPKEKEK